MAKKEAEKFIDSTLLEGMVSISALISSLEEAPAINDRRIVRVLFDSEKQKSKAREISYLRRKSEKLGFSLEFCSAEEIEQFTIGNTHGGVIAFCSERSFQTLTSELLDSFRTGNNGIKAELGFFVFIDGVEDPYNFGYSMRSLYAAGVDGIILSPRNWMNAAGIVCRASAGASERMPIFISEPEDAVRLFHDAGYRIVSTDLKKSVPLSEANVDFPLLLVVGGEKRGISKPLIDGSDEIVRLEYGRDFPAALSTASAASIIAFEVLRRNREK